MFVCLLDKFILVLCYSDLTWETGGFELELTINFILPPIFNHWFTFYSDSRNYESWSSLKGFLKFKTVIAKKYGRKLWQITQYHHRIKFKKLFGLIYYEIFHILN